MVEVQPPSDVFGATDVVTVYALGVDDVAIEHLCEQKSPETFRDRGLGGAGGTIVELLGASSGTDKRI